MDEAQLNKDEQMLEFKQQKPSQEQESSAAKGSLQNSFVSTLRGLGRTRKAESQLKAADEN